MAAADDFVKAYLPQALKVEKETGFSYLIPLTQAALESAWGEKAPGFNFFGIKAGSKTPLTDKQLITTTEYLKSANAKFPHIIKKTLQPNGLYKYTVKDWFMKYRTAQAAFKAHVQFFLDNPRYKNALQYKNDPDKFFEEIAKAGYATAPAYAAQLKAVKLSILKRLPK